MLLVLRSMADTARKDKRWNSVVSNARAIRGALNECLKLSDQMTDVELKGEAIKFVNAMEYLATTLLGEQTRVKPRRSTERDLIARLREEVAHIRQLTDENERIAHELGDSEAKRVSSTSINTVKKFTGIIDRKQR